MIFSSRTLSFRYTSAFNMSYSKLDLLIRLYHVDKTFAVSSTRHAGLSFSPSLTLSYLNYERHYLYKHMIQNYRIKKIVCGVLKIPISTSMEPIQKKIETGHAIKQVGTYRQIYERIKRIGT